MWFFKFAQTREDFLKTLNIDDDVRNFILSQEEDIANKLTSYIVAHPKADIEDLENFIRKKNKIKKDVFSEKELKIANRYNQDPIFYQWVLNQLKKHRYLKNIEDDLNLNHNIEREFALIYDWYRFNNINNIKSFSLRDAIRHEQEWHKSLQEGESYLYYTPIKPENIIYGPQWENPKWDGWTIQKVETADLTCEGEKMHHCVGQYKDDVLRNKIRIFSLRDPNNNPHITIGMNGDDNIVFEYAGKNNSLPTEEQKEMIREWFISLGNVKNDTVLGNDSDVEFQNFEELKDYYKNQIEKIKKERLKRKDGDKFDDYGFLINTKNQYNIFSDIFDFELLKKIAEMRRNWFNRGIDRRNIQLVDETIKYFLEAMYLKSLEQINKLYTGEVKLTEENINNIYFRKFLDELYEHYEELTESFNKDYDYDYDYYIDYFKDMSEEEIREFLDRQYEEDLREYLLSSDEGYLILEFFDQINKNYYYRNFYNLYIKPLLEKKR